MKKCIKNLALVAMTTVLFQAQSLAATFSVGFTRDNISYVTLNGNIEAGDGAQFAYVVNTWKAKHGAPTFLLLNSNGGAVYEAYSILKTVLENNIGTAVLGTNTCASACVAIFASGSPRSLSPESTIGVHRASSGGQDDTYAKAASVEMIKVYKDLNIPDDIRLKMIETDPSNMYFLTLSEKRAFSTNSILFEEAKQTVRQSPIPVIVKTETTRDRKYARALNAQAITAINANDFYKAIPALEEARNITPTDAEILGNLGYSYYRIGQYGQAQTTLTASLNLRPKRGSSWNNLGLVLSALGDEDWAVDCFIKYWQFSKNKTAATNQFFYWEERQPGTVLDRASKRARMSLGLYNRVY